MKETPSARGVPAMTPTWTRMARTVSSASSSFFALKGSIDGAITAARSASSWRGT